jgi:hypothetical protein
MLEWLFRTKKQKLSQSLRARGDVMTAQAAMRRMTLPFTELRSDMIDPTVLIDGNVAVLTFSLLIRRPGAVNRERLTI